MRQEDSQADWDAFVKDVTWFARGREKTAKLSALPNRAFGAEAAELFPKLNVLLQRATITDVSLGREHYELYGWTSAVGVRFGWLCMPPSAEPSSRLHRSHRELLRSFGGIVERFNEPDDTWLLNLNDALTERVAASSDRGSYAAVFDGPVPIDSDAYYPIAIEANGNTTLCHRESGSILLFAPDHSFDHIAVLPGCPDYTFYTIRGVEELREWVETVAQQWSRHLATA
jgi:hypothetical protein